MSTDHDSGLPEEDAVKDEAKTNDLVQTTEANYAAEDEQPGTEEKDMTQNDSPKDNKEKTPMELDPTSDDPMKLPPHGTEVYIGGITKNATETQIREFCEQKGEVFRLQCPKDLDNPGQNRGYAFVTYITREAAHDAVASLNQTEMKDFPEKRVCVLLSQVKNRLFVGNIPRDITREELKELFEKEVRGVEEVELLMDHGRGVNRGFCFVECYNHGAADLARRTLSRPDFKIRDRSVTVTWAEPRKVDPEREKVKSVYIGNLPESITETDLRDIFKAYGEIEKIVLLPLRDGRGHRDYGFVHYVERACALKAVEAAESNPLTLEDRQLRVSIARPTQRDDGSDGSAQGSWRSAAWRHRGRDDDYYYHDDRNIRGANRRGSGYDDGSYATVPYGMALMPTYLPNGQLGFIFQQPPSHGTGGPTPMSRESRPYGGGNSRYRPY